MNTGRGMGEREKNKIIWCHFNPGDENVYSICGLKLIDVDHRNLLNIVVYDAYPPLWAWKYVKKSSLVV